MRYVATLLAAVLAAMGADFYANAHYIFCGAFIGLALISMYAVGYIDGRQRIFDEPVTP